MLLEVKDLHAGIEGKAILISGTGTTFAPGVDIDLSLHEQRCVAADPDAIAPQFAK